MNKEMPVLNESRDYGLEKMETSAGADVPHEDSKSNATDSSGEYGEFRTNIVATLTQK